MSFKEIGIDELKINPIEMIGGEWWVIAAGTEDKGFNGMTASWGHMGSLWERPGGRAHMGLPTVVVYLRPQRYTKEFIDREDTFTLSVFGKGHRKALAYLGSHTGREGDKMKGAGVTPVFDQGTTYFDEAKLVFVCKKIYHAPLLEEGFVDWSLVENNYKKKDFHEMYIGEILKVLVKTDSQ